MSAVGLPALARRHPLLALAFTLALGATIFFGARMVLKTLYWMDPAHQAQALEPWMTPRYIAHGWQVDARALARALGASPDPDERPTLETIAERRGVPLEQVIAEAQAFLATHAPGTAPGTAPPGE